MPAELVLTSNFERIIFETIPSLTDLYTCVSASVPCSTNVVAETAKGFIDEMARKLEKLEKELAELKKENPEK